MTSIAAAMSKARGLLCFIGVMALLGADWSTWERIALGLALVVVVAVNITADGHRLWAQRIKRTHYDTVA